MLIKGKERKFELNVQSHEELAELCRNQDLANVDELFTVGTKQTVENVIKFAIIMNRGYEDHAAFENPMHAPEYLTEQDFRFMSMQQIGKLQEEILAAMNAGEERLVETEEIKASGKNGEKEKESPSV